MSFMSVSPEFYWLAVTVVTVLSAARLSRLATSDAFPPVVWLREKYERATDGSEWQLLALCAYCASFWLTALVVTGAALSGVLVWSPLVEWFEPAWWIFNGAFAASYLAVITMAHDGVPAGSED